MRSKPGHSVNRDITNKRAIERACTKLRDRLLSELKVNPTMHGSVAATIQVNGGLIDRFRVTADETEKCDAVLA
ncbi:MAG: hypothetical protein ACO1RT_16205 [Planctomycetaceae bacterium]